MSIHAVTDSLPLDAPVRIDRPTMLQRWTQLSFVHWAYEPDAVRVCRTSPGSRVSPRPTCGPT